MAQEGPTTPKISGTIRGKYEYQTEEGEALRHDDKFMYVSCWEYQGDDKDPVMLKEPLNYEFVVPQTRNYKK